jgi:putative component of membrane protein insertase Oxa1/YidC/SpoIIIJ protein YidD
MKLKTILMFMLWPVNRGLGLLAWLGVWVYRRWISPYKGFCCAYAALTKEPSCSAVGLQAFRENTFSQAIPIIWAQLSRCRAAYINYKNALKSDPKALVAKFGAAATLVAIGCCAQANNPKPPPPPKEGPPPAKQDPPPDPH